MTIRVLLIAVLVTGCAAKGPTARRAESQWPAPAMALSLAQEAYRMVAKATDLTAEQRDTIVYNLDYVQAAAETLREHGRPADSETYTEIVEHADELRHYLVEARDVVKGTALATSFQPLIEAAERVAKIVRAR